jgi:hypothetical protein
MLGSNLNANLDPDKLLVRDFIPFGGGPIAAGGVLAPWIPLGLVGPFVFNPGAAPSFIVDVQMCALAAGWSQGMDTFTAGGTIGKMLAATSGCTSSFGSSPVDTMPALRVTWQPVPAPAWQENTPEAHLDVNGIPSSAFRPIRVTATVGQVLVIN